MAIKTRQTTGTGVTNNNAPLSNSDLDNNFVELVAADAAKLDKSGGTLTGALTTGSGVTLNGAQTGGYPTLGLQSGSASTSYITMGTSADPDEGTIEYRPNSDTMSFKAGATYGFQITDLAYVKVYGNSTYGSGAIRLNCEANTHGVTIKGPPHSAAANYTLTLPNNDGSNGQVLTTNGSGGLSWTSVSTSSYNDASVNTHLNTSSASANDILSWNGSDYAWVAQSSGGSGVTVQDEGSNLSTAATTLNFTGAGVTASGTGSTKTINIAGGGSASVEMTKVNASPSSSSFPSNTWIKIADFNGIVTTGSVGNYVIDVLMEGNSSEYASHHVRLHVRTETTYTQRRWVHWELLDRPRPWETYPSSSSTNFWNNNSFKMWYSNSTTAALYVKLPSSTNLTNTNCFAKIVNSLPAVAADTNGESAMTIATNQSWLTSTPTGLSGVTIYPVGRVMGSLVLNERISFTGADDTDNNYSVNLLTGTEPTASRQITMPNANGRMMVFNGHASNFEAISDGNAGQVLTTNGAGLLTFDDAVASGVPTGTSSARPANPTAGKLFFNTTTGHIEFYDGSNWQELDTFSSAPVASALGTYQIYSGSDGQYYASWGYFPVGWQQYSSQTPRSTSAGTITNTTWIDGSASIAGVACYSNPGGSGLVVYLNGSVTNSGWTRMDWERTDGSNAGSALRTAFSFATNTSTGSWTHSYQLHYTGSFTGTAPATTGRPAYGSAPPTWTIKIY